MIELLEKGRVINYYLCLETKVSLEKPTHSVFSSKLRQAKTGKLIKGFRSYDRTSKQTDKQSTLDKYNSSKSLNNVVNALLHKNFSNLYESAGTT